MAELDPKLLESNEAHLVALEESFRKAMQLLQNEDDSGARALFEKILQDEPRLAEPRLELAHMDLLAGRHEEAETQARLALATLQAGGQWTKDVEPPILLSFAKNLLGETIARSLEEGDLFLTDQHAFTRRWNEASRIFGDAARLDPTNEDALRNLTRFAPLPDVPGELN